MVREGRDRRRGAVRGSAGAEVDVLERRLDGPQTLRDLAKAVFITYQPSKFSLRKERTDRSDISRSPELLACIGGGAKV